MQKIIFLNFLFFLWKLFFFHFFFPNISSTNILIASPFLFILYVYAKNGDDGGSVVTGLGYIEADDDVDDG